MQPPISSFQQEKISSPMLHPSNANLPGNRSSLPICEVDPS